MTILEGLSTNLASVIGEASQSIVQVRNRHGGAGAGTIWHSDGLIITNAHVVREGSPTIVLRDGSEHSARILAHDAEQDIAALSIDASDLKPMALGESAKVRPGEWVVAIGHPWGVRDAATAGVVIGVGSGWPG